MAAQMTGNEEGIHVQHGSTLIYDPKLFQGPEAAAMLALRAFLAELLIALRLGCDVLVHPPTEEPAHGR